MSHTNRIAKGGRTDGQSRTYTEVSVYQGALPDPESMAKYEKIYPGFTQAVLNSFTKEGDHRRAHETASLVTYNKTARWGIAAAIVSVVIISSLSAFAIYCGHPTTGSVIACTIIVGLVTTLIGGKKATASKTNN